MKNDSSSLHDLSRSYRLLAPTEWGEIKSPYIEGGYKEDSFTITRLKFNDNEIIATCKMTQYYISGTDDAGFHLSIWTSVAMLGQIAIIHAHAINNVWRKDYEALLGKFSSELNRPIRTPDKISVKMRIIDQRLKLSESKQDLIRAAYTWDYDIEQEAFTGQLKAHFSFANSEGSFDGVPDDSKFKQKDA